jgi:hypothetical protein
VVQVVDHRITQAALLELPGVQAAAVKDLHKAGQVQPETHQAQHRVKVIMAVRDLLLLQGMAAAAAVVLVR